MNDRLDHIFMFVQAAEAGSFVAAAQRLNLTRSAISKNIAGLEQRLGARLFNRTTRQQNLTEAGQAYYAYCVRALGELEAAEAALQSCRREPQGLLRISVPQIFGRYCVAPVLRELVQKYSGLNIEVSFGNRAVDLFEEKYDLAVRVGSLPDSASLTARKLGMQHFSVVAAPSYLAVYGKPANVSELKGHAAIAYVDLNRRDTSWVGSNGKGRMREAGVNVRLRLDSLQAIADAAICGVGLACLPTWLVPVYLRNGELVRVMDCPWVKPAEIHLVWPLTRFLPAKIRVAVDALVTQLPGKLEKFSGVPGGIQV